MIIQWQKLPLKQLRLNSLIIEYSTALKSWNMSYLTMLTGIIITEFIGR